MGLFFLVLKSHTIAPPKSPKIKPRGPVMSIQLKALGLNQQNYLNLVFD